MLLLLETATFVLVTLQLVASEDVETCGYESCLPTKPDMLNVHIIAHTHMDVGWLKTPDQYYFGTKANITTVGVQYILDSLLTPLEKNPDRKFILVETYYISKWWDLQDENTKARFRRLVQSGQIEFISGGWCMNDEASVHYSNTIDQMTLGLQILKNIFGKCGVPRIGWQVDPFGHSREFASILAQMHFDGHFVGRIDYQDKVYREATKNMEFVWKASTSLGESAYLFTGVLPHTYSPPPGFCFDVLCQDEPIVNDTTSDEYNVDSRIDQFLKYVTIASAFYKTNNIQVTMGEDFNYQSAARWFDNLDKLIYHANERQVNGSKINLIYSTPSCYLKAVHEANFTWSNVTDDLFPYSSDPHAFWTGYFTSRPALKGMDRHANNLLQAYKQQGVFAKLDASCQPLLDSLRKSLAVFQHHDAVSGTSKQAVANDYVKRLYKGIVDAQNYSNSALGVLMCRKGGPPPVQLFCNTLNISACDVTERGKTLAVTVYNPTGRTVDGIVRIPVAEEGHSLLDSKGIPVDAEYAYIPDGVISLPGRRSAATLEVLFRAKLPPLGFVTYFLKKGNNTSLSWKGKRNSIVQKSFIFTAGKSPNDIGLQGKKITAVIDGVTGLLKQIRYGSIAVNVKQSFYWYEAMNGNNTEYDYRASGAYIFRPNGTTAFGMDANVTLNVSMSPSFMEARQNFTPWLSQVIRVYREEEYVEFDWVVGPIPVEDGIGKEIITRFDTDLSTEGKFYTDSSGREIIQRIRDHRNTWKAQIFEPISGNYYPVNSRIFLKDEDRNVQFSILTDRSHGGSSLHDGSVELMLHRRLLHDDAFGVSEALNEPGYGGKGLVIRGKHYVLLNMIPYSARPHRELAQRLYMSPVLSFSRIKSIDDYIKKYETSFSGLAADIPLNINILTLEPWLQQDKSVLLRLEHMYEYIDRSGFLSKPTNVSLKAIFGENISNVQETTLGANVPLEESTRLKFTTVPDREERITKLIPAEGPEYNVLLRPMQIRTFIVQLQ